MITTNIINENKAINCYDWQQIRFKDSGLCWALTLTMLGQHLPEEGLQWSWCSAQSTRHGQTGEKAEWHSTVLDTTRQHSTAAESSLNTLMTGTQTLSRHLSAVEVSAVSVTNARIDRKNRILVCMRRKNIEFMIDVTKKPITDDGVRRQWCERLSKWARWDCLGEALHTCTLRN